MNITLIQTMKGTYAKAYINLEDKQYQFVSGIKSTGAEAIKETFLYLSLIY